MKRTLPIFGISLLVFALGGCLVPEGRRVIAGRQYSAESIAFLDAPDATRQETIATLGLPSWESSQSKVLLYLWNSAQKWRFVPPESWKNAGIRESVSETGEQRWALLIAYDRAGMVTAHTARRINSLTLEQACVIWSRERMTTENP